MGRQSEGGGEKNPEESGDLRVTLQRGHGCNGVLEIIEVGLLLQSPSQ